jgi:hypothetical protein
MFENSQDREYLGDVDICLIIVLNWAIDNAICTNNL